MNKATPNGVDLLGPMEPGYRAILAPHALSFLIGLHRRFDGRRKALLEDRQKRQAEFDAGSLPDFPEETADIRNGPCGPPRPISGTAVSRSLARSIARWW